MFSVLCTSEFEVTGILLKQAKYLLWIMHIKLNFPSLVPV